MKQQHGFTLVETIVAIGVFSIFFLAVALIFQQILQNIGISRVRSIALTLAQTKLETIKNLPYEQVGTQGGIPSGTLPQSEIQTVNGLTFTISTSIFYIDDPFDQQAPTDPIPADYKRVRIQVNWEGLYQSNNPVSLVTNITPKGLESNPGGGILSIQVLNAQGLPVPSASVTITNTIINPPINVTTLTDQQGLVVIPAAPACVTCYNITTTKTGYSTDKTYTSTEVANPLLPPATVLTGNVTPLTLSIDQVGSLSVTAKSTVETGYQPLVNVIFALKGSKIIGYDTQDKPQYKYSRQFTTGGGVLGIPNLEWDTYTLDLTDSNYTLAGINPLNPVTVLPGVFNTPVTFTAGPKYASSLQITFKNTLQERMASVAALLKNVNTGNELLKITPATSAADFGQVFYNNLTAGTYLLIASLSGYQEATNSYTITTNTQSTVVLNPL